MVESQSNAVVVPLTPFGSSEPSTEDVLRKLINREAVLVSKSTRESGGTATGIVAQSTGSFAKAMALATSQVGGVAQSSGDLYRVILPAGATARDLVPAVGGGFRGLVRSASSGTKITGHVRLIPAVTTTGATLTAGPLIATVGLAMAGEMLAEHQLTKKLDAIHHTVSGIKDRMDAHDQSVLVTARQQTRKVTSYLLDQAKLPQFSSASYSFGELESLTNMYVTRFDRWREIGEKYSHSDHVYGPELLEALTNERENQAEVFERMVIQTYEALSLRAEVVVLEKVATELSNPNHSLAHVENVLHQELGSIALRQTQLSELMEDLSLLPLDSTKIPFGRFAGKKMISAHTTFSKLSKALHAAPDSLPILTESDQTVLDLKPAADGLSIVRPDSESKE